MQPFMGPQYVSQPQRGDGLQKLGGWTGLYRTKVPPKPKEGSPPVAREMHSSI